MRSLCPGRRCGLSLVVHHGAALSRSGAALTSSSSSFWGFTPGRTDHWTHGGGSEDYCHASERAWSGPSWRRGVSGSWRSTSGKGTEKSRVSGGNMNSVVERCQLRTGMLWASGTKRRKGEEMIPLVWAVFTELLHIQDKRKLCFLNDWRSQNVCVFSFFEESPSGLHQWPSLTPPESQTLVSAAFPSCSWPGRAAFTGCSIKSSWLSSPCTRPSASPTGNNGVNGQQLWRAHCLFPKICT